MGLVSGIAHVNLTVPTGTLDLADEFYGHTIGLTRASVPAAQRHELAWYDISSTGQQIHISYPKTSNDVVVESSRQHVCFKVDSLDDLLKLQRAIWAHYEKGGASAPVSADQPGQENSGAKGIEYPTRFFARDYANNRLEFSL